jgi:hypothetical protein
VQSLEWMADARVAAVNISLPGPRNAILDWLIERASARHDHGRGAVPCSAGCDSFTMSHPLRTAAHDVGAPGRDPVYGWGVFDPR